VLDDVAGSICCGGINVSDDVGGTYLLHTACMTPINPYIPPMYPYVSPVHPLYAPNITPIQPSFTPYLSIYTP